MRKALVVGINDYDTCGNLNGCVKDATLMAEVLSKNEDESPNYDCRTFTTPQDRVTRAFLRQRLGELFEGNADAAVFFFAGHGSTSASGGFLATQDATSGDPGILMDEVLTLANTSAVKEVFLILDCCFAGSLGNPPSMQGLENKALLREGVTILASCKSNETAAEVGGQGMFTAMVLHALHGAAADVLGRVSAAAIYAHVEQALGAWDQRPLYKSYATRLSPVRQCEPRVSAAVLRSLPKIFADPVKTLPLDPSYEHSSKTAETENVATFNLLKFYRNAGLVRTVTDDDLYYAAMHSTGVRLTGLGRYYWHLAKSSRI